MAPSIKVEQSNYVHAIQNIGTKGEDFCTAKHVYPKPPPNIGFFLLTTLRRQFQCFSLFAWFWVDRSHCLFLLYTSSCQLSFLSSIVITSPGKRELLAVLAVCLCVNVFWFPALLLFLLVPEEGSGDLGFVFLISLSLFCGAS